jgi:phosphoribosylamine--glycine ligase
MAEIVEPVVQGLARRGTPYHGVLYAGLMVYEGRARLLEFNVRFGDPEAQVLLVRLRSDLVELVDRATTGRLAGTRIEWDPRPAVCVVLAAEGYPGAVEKGRTIEGLDRTGQDALVFHAGTRREGSRIVTDGGRVLGVTALGDTLGDAIGAAYRTIEHIRWPGMQYRRDIGHRALARGAA